MKLNKSKLRKFAASGEVVAAPASLKHKKTNEGPLKVMEQSSSRPPIRDVVPLVKIVPPVIMVDIDLSLPTDPSSMDDATVNQSPHVAMSRAKDVISQRDMDAYSSAHSEDVHYLLVHSLMRVWVFTLFSFLFVFCLIHFCISGFEQGDGDEPEMLS